MRAVLTRDRDEFLTLRDRIRRAREANADLFVSIHADSVVNSSVSGSSVYVLSERGATNEAARRLADLENAADLKGGSVEVMPRDRAREPPWPHPGPSRPFARPRSWPPRSLPGHRRAQKDRFPDARSMLASDTAASVMHGPRAMTATASAVGSDRHQQLLG